MGGVGYNLRRTAAGTVIQASSGGNAGLIYPFQIRQTSSWLHYEVMAGYAITDGSPFVPVGAGDSEVFELTSGVSFYYIYLDLIAEEIFQSSTVPTWGVDIVPIGWVDTATHSADSRAVIVQFTRDHIFSPCVEIE